MAERRSERQSWRGKVKKKEETKYRQTFCLGRKKKFDMSPLGLLCGAEERHFGESATERDRETHTQCRGREGERDASVLSPIFARSEVFRLV